MLQIHRGLQISTFSSPHSSDAVQSRFRGACLHSCLIPTPFSERNSHLRPHLLRGYQNWRLCVFPTASNQAEPKEDHELWAMPSVLCPKKDSPEP